VLEAETCGCICASDKLAVVEGEGKPVRLICGAFYGARSPVQTFSEMFWSMPL
jgi:hypothetical protein